MGSPRKAFSSDDAYRALDSAARVAYCHLRRGGGGNRKMKMELLRVRFDEQVRNERRKKAGTAIASPVAGNLKPWREVITPHRDVAGGHYQQARICSRPLAGVPGRRKLLNTVNLLSFSGEPF